MISNSSLSAFSAATIAPQGAQPPRLVRVQAAPGPAPAAKTALPTQRPSISPPRGTLINLSV